MGLFFTGAFYLFISDLYFALQHSLPTSGADSLAFLIQTQDSLHYYVFSKSYCSVAYESYFSKLEPKIFVRSPLNFKINDWSAGGKKIPLLKGKF